MSFLSRLGNWFSSFWKDELPQSKSIMKPRQLPKVVPPKAPVSEKEPTVQAQAVSTFTYYLNDAQFPNLARQVTAPTIVNMPTFTVQGYVAPNGYGPNTKEGRAAQTFYSVWSELEWLKGVKPVTKWAATTNLLVLPEAGLDLNAYYDRKSLRFFYYPDNKLQNPMVYACQSADVVCHETGHAVLDFYQPRLWFSMATEVGAFHESFADCMAMFTTMQFDEMLSRALSETNNDLSKPNVIARLAEQLGLALWDVTNGQQGESKDFLRCAVNTFRYTKPSLLPRDGSDSTLTSEVHSFSRVFTGAVYDIFVMLWRDGVSRKMSYLDAAKFARDRAANYLIRAALMTPPTTKYYEAVAKSILWVDSNQFGNTYFYRLKSILALRNLVSAGAKIKAQEVDQCDDSRIKIKDFSKTIKLSDHVIRAQDNDNPLYDVEIDVPQADVYYYDRHGRFLDCVTVTNDEAIEATQGMIETLHHKKLVSDDPKTPFEIKDGKLVRTFFDCHHHH